MVDLDLKMIVIGIGTIYTICTIGIGIDIGYYFYKQRERDQAGIVLRKAEKERLSTPHDLQQQLVGSKQELPENFVGWDISLCYINRTDPFQNKHFFLIFTRDDAYEAQQEWKLDFSLSSDYKKGKVTLEKTFAQQECKKETTQKVTEEIVDRICSVLYATNFSYCLRNSENFATYIYDGKWQSFQLQMSTQKQSLRKIFDDILTQEDRKYLGTLPKDIAEKIHKNADVMFPEMSGMMQFKRVSKLQGFKLPKEAYNIIFVGPTGAGKSTLINLLFNSTICETQKKEKPNFASVTREACVVSGVHCCPDGEVPVNVIDTMGVCDTFLENTEALDNLFIDIISEHSKIDKVVFVTYEIISDAHKEAMVRILDRFQYPRQNVNKSKDFKEKRNNFVFLYNKTENMPEEEKLNKVEEMGDKLGVDIGHKIPVEMLFPGKEDTGMLVPVIFKAGLATGINQTGEFDDATKETCKQLKSLLLPHTRRVLMSPQRLSIAQLQCPIQ